MQEWRQGAVLLLIFSMTVQTYIIQDCVEFFKLLALCHTVLPSTEEGQLKYNAQSPDEAALVSAARNFGFVFKNRSPFTVTLHNMTSGKEVGWLIKG